ncbi:MAG: DUF5522 domain-containing protein [Flavitalea sp.]
MKKKLTEGADYYYTPDGYMVLTEEYHLERGKCCGNGCRHCPYDYIEVPEPRKSDLLRQRIIQHEKEDGEKTTSDQASTGKKEESGT